MSSALSLSQSLDDTTITPFRIPLSIVLKWPSPNLINPNRQLWVVPYIAVLHAVVTIVVAARIWTRVRKQAGVFGVDDILIIGAWIFAGGLAGCVIYGVEVLGMDKHLWDQDPAKTGTGGLVAWVIELLFLASLTLTKISVLLFFRRLIDGSYSRWVTRAIWAAVAFTIAYYIAFTLFLILACDPVEANWKSMDLTWMTDYKCVNRSVPDEMVGVLSVISDIYSMFIPVYIVSKLRMPKAQKVVLYIVFCCGLLVCGAGAARTYYLSRLHTDPVRDLTRVALYAMVWGNLEMQLAIICASAPAMTGFFSVVHSRLIEAYGSRKTSSKDRSTDQNNFSKSNTEHFFPKSNSIANTKGSNFKAMRVSKGFQAGDVCDVYESGARVSSPDSNHSPPWDNEMSADWREEYDHHFLGKTSDELLNAPGKRVKVQRGGILVTETFSIASRHGGLDDFDFELGKGRNGLGVA